MTDVFSQKAERRQDSTAKTALKQEHRAKVLADVKRFNDGDRTTQEVANMAGISYSAAKNIIRRYGLGKPKTERQT